jgi:hypothetical protein
MAERTDFIPIIGVIHLHTSLGTFLDVGERESSFLSSILRLCFAAMRPVKR